MTCLFPAGEMLVETGKMLFAAFDGAMFLDHAVAVLGRREHRAHGDPGLVAFAANVTVCGS